MGKGVGRKKMQLVQTSARRKGNLEHVPLMPAVSADGALYKSVLFLPEKLSHFQKVNGVHQTIQSVWPSCFLFQRETAGVDATIVHEWVKGFVRRKKAIATKYLSHCIVARWIWFACLVSNFKNIEGKQGGRSGFTCTHLVNNLASWRVGV